MGLFSFIGGLLGGGSQKKGINQATNAQMQYLDKALNQQQAQYDTTRSDFAPYREAGTGALGDYSDLLGMNGPDAAAKAIAALKASPMFQSLFKTGQEAVLQNASATGGLRGGNTEHSLYDLGSNTLSQLIEDQLSRLGGLASLGEGATAQGAGFGAHSADAMSSLFGQQGGALASKYLAKAGINAQNWNNAGGFLDQAASMIPGLGPFSALF
jgi:hypothetical protein